MLPLSWVRQPEAGVLTAGNGLDWRRTWGLWLTLAVLWLGTLPLRPLLDPDEGRYAEIPREMAASGDWVTPRLNDLKYFEKPPLQYWATAALYSVLGVSEASARLWPVALAFLCLPLVFGFARGVGYTKEVAVVATATLAVNPYFLILGQLNLLDQGFTFFMVAALFAFVLAQRTELDVARERRWMLLSWTCLALAILSKGLAALVLTGITLTVYMAFTRNFTLLRRMHFGLGIPLLLVLTVPWFWLVQQRNPEFAQFFFVHEHFARFLTDVSERQEPWWYFLMIAALAMLPVAANFAAVRRAGISPQRPAPQFQVEKFLLIWCVVVVVFFSFSHSKLAPYILPIMPPLAVLLARGLATDPRAHRRTAAAACGFFVLLASALIAYSLRRHGSIGAGSAVWALTGVVASLAAFLFARRRTHERANAAWLAIAAAAILAVQGLIMAYAFLPPMRSAKMLAADLAPLGGRSTIYSVGQFRHTLVFYLEHPMEVFGYTGELEFGLTQAGAGPREIADFRQRWAAEHDALAFMDPALFAQLHDAGMPGHVIARDARSVAVSRQ